MQTPIPNLVLTSNQVKAIKKQFFHFGPNRKQRRDEQKKLSGIFFTNNRKVTRGRLVERTKPGKAGYAHNAEASWQRKVANLHFLSRQ